MIKSLGDFLKIHVHACVGGTAVREDINILMNGVHVVVGTYVTQNIPLVREQHRRYAYAVLLLLSGTPGRVYDMISRRALKLDDVKLFVLDEADEMLSRGFKEQIYDGNVCMLWWMYKCMYVRTYV